MWFQFRILGRLIGGYLDALMDGNPFAVGVAILGSTALGMGPFHDGLKRGDTGAIVLSIAIAVGALLLLVLAVVDRKLNGPKKKKADARRSAGTRR